MSLPPLVLDLRVAQPDRRPFHLWLPLFLLWPLVLVVFLVAVAVAAVMDAVALASGRPHRTTLFVIGVLSALTEARGTEFDIENDKASVHLTVS
jgi:hypothetical protein